MEKKSNGLIRLDPAVEAALGTSGRMLAEKSLSKRERKSKARERNKAEARKGKRALYDLDPEVIHAIQRIAETNHTTASQVARLALAMFLDAVWSGNLDVREYRKPIDNPRYEYTLVYPKKS